MSDDKHSRVSKASGWVDSKKLEKGPNGRNLCRWCSTEVPKGRRTFCSDECIDKHRITTDPGYVRAKLFERDQGVCKLCGLDTYELCKSMDANHWGWDGWRAKEMGPEVQEAKNKLGLGNSGHRLTTNGVWDADHIVPVVEGGGSCGLDNYRTLCVPCHKGVTRDLRTRLAAK